MQVFAWVWFPCDMNIDTSLRQTMTSVNILHKTLQAVSLRPQQPDVTHNQPLYLSLPPLFPSAGCQVGPELFWNSCTQKRSVILCCCSSDSSHVQSATLTSACQCLTANPRLTRFSLKVPKREEQPLHGFPGPRGKHALPLLKCFTFTAW